MTDREPTNKGRPSQPDPWTEFFISNNQAVTTILNGMFDLGVAWLKLIFNQWLVNYYRDLYKKDRQEKGYSS